MQAIGSIETLGFIAAIEAADIMLKTADVSLVQKEFVGAGLVSITITGDVGAVKAAIESGCAAVTNFSDEHLIAKHIIPRPHEEIVTILFEAEGTKEDANKMESRLEVQGEIELSEINEDIPKKKEIEKKTKSNKKKSKS